MSIDLLEGKDGLADYAIVQICHFENKCPDKHKEELKSCHSSVAVFRVLIETRNIRFWSLTLLESILKKYLPEDDMC